MKKFNFRLERILQLKEHTEKEKQKVLALATHKVLTQESKLHQIDWTRQQIQKDQIEHLTGAIDSGRLSIYSRYYLRLKKDELTGIAMLRALRKTQDEKRQELIEATRQKKIFEILKERRKARYYKELELSIQKEQDELASRIIQYKKRPPK